MEAGNKFTSQPMKLITSDVPPGLLQCDDNQGIKCAKFALEQLENSQSGFPVDFFPKRTLVWCALLGSYSVHNRVFNYNKSISLEDIIENKINKNSFEKYIIAVNSSDKYYCFKADIFKYSTLDELKNVTNSIDFIVAIPNSGGLFVFFEDSPACFMSFKQEVDFEENFISAEKASSIFSQHMDDWRITTYEKERIWLEKVNQAMASSQTD